MSTCNYCSINSCERKLANKTVNYDKEIKMHKFEQEVRVMNKINPSERTDLNRVFEEGV